MRGQRPPAQDHEARPLLGMALMVAAMLLIPLVDAIAKLLSADHSPLYVSWARYACATIVVLPLAAARHGKDILPRTGFAAHTLRTIFLVSAMTLFFVAISMVPLATALGAYFIAPIIAALLAVVILKERLTIAKALAGCLAFAGAMAIVRPGAGMEVGTLYAVGAGFLFACYLVATRMATRSSRPLPTLVFQCALGSILLLPQAIYTWVWPSMMAIGLIILMGTISVASHALSITAFRHADTGTLAPLVYTELIATAVVGYLVFAEIPTALTWAGIAVIVVSGLMIARER